MKIWEFVESKHARAGYVCLEAYEADYVFRIGGFSQLGRESVRTLCI